MNAGGGPKGDGRGPTLLVAGAFFMENLDGTIISTAAPDIAASFGVRPVDISITMTAYLVALAVFIPVSGWAADRYGARRVFAWAIAVFTVASALCAAATGLPELVVMRVLQGIGGAMMVPVGRLVVLRGTRKTDLLRAIAYLTWPGLLAPVAAPALGGLFTTYASWRWIFLVNVPLGVVALLLALRMVPDLREPERPALDRTGFLLGGAGLAAAVYGLELFGGPPRSWGTAAAWLAGGLLMCAVTVFHFLRVRRPLLDPTTMRVHTFRVANVGGALFRAAISAVPLLLPLMFQGAFGWSAATAGLVLIAVFAGNVAVKPVTTPLLRRFGFRTVLLVNGAATAVTFLLCAALGPRTPMAVVLGVLFVSGVCRSVSLSAYASLGFADIEPDRTSGANALSSTIQQLAAGLGVAFGALALRAAGPLAPHLGLEGPTAAYRVAFALLALLPLGCMVEAARLRRDAGAVVTGRAPPGPTGGTTGRPGGRPREHQAQQRCGIALFGPVRDDPKELVDAPDSGQ
ncbi:MFS transporter [Streptomyces sporangiiformans]|uniref:Multidrug efflux MFS transporter n=1 Tax=Streptomyces sporangiiformans TaxID=2315329 RepID=A0A505DSZ9_9ACTN|nr:MFS transporter [Streptomyces sporangiiformans]TPQ24082.1 multidrug efflux MFS transporter [Streptomyces sporangiiformans]